MAKPPQQSVFSATPYDPAQAREEVRATVTYVFIGLFSMVVISYLAAAMWPHVDDAHWIRLKDVMQIVLPAVAGTLGTALGFYFGSLTRA